MSTRVAPAWTLGVLAGGRSRRMGRDKASLELDEHSLLEHQIRRLAPPGVPVLVGTRPDGPGRDMGHPWVPDCVADAGPLASLAALLAACETPWLLVVPCDAPLLPADLGDALLAHGKGVEAVLLEVDDRVEPLPALVASDLAPVVRDALDAGARRMDSWRDGVACSHVPFDRIYPDLVPGDVLLNVNAPEDLQRARVLLRRGTGSR
ncbi:MAG: hypothetical protein CMJ83_13385 [Planctomycetes bacterium]|nr:hypothetical protein [Planctomycetota bacterium]